MRWLLKRTEINVGPWDWGCLSKGLPFTGNERWVGASTQEGKRKAGIRKLHNTAELSVHLSWDFHSKLLWHPEIPSSYFSFFKHLTRRRPLCTTALWLEQFEGGNQGFIFPLMITTECSLDEICDSVGKFLLSKVGCVYLGMHESWESGNLTLKSCIGNIPLEEECSRSYGLYSFHLSVIWINCVLVLQFMRFFSSHLTFLFLWF